jgi:hypothetical protein
MALGLSQAPANSFHPSTARRCAQRSSLLRLVAPATLRPVFHNPHCSNRS